MKHIQKWFAGGAIASIITSFSLVRYFASGNKGEVRIPMGKIGDRIWREEL